MEEDAGEEFFDVVDEADRVVGRLGRSEVHRRKLRHRAIHVFIDRPDGRFLLQKRSPSKDTAPNRWCSSCSGHVDAGEDYATAALRELGEEVGVGARPDQLMPAFKVDARRETGMEFVWLYRLTWGGGIVPDPGEIARVDWFAPEEIDAWVRREPRAFARSFAFLWRRWRALPEAN